MRVNIYAEEMTDRLEIISKEVDGHEFTGLRFYLELPVTIPRRTIRATLPQLKADTGPTLESEIYPHGIQTENVSGPFIHRQDDDDSSAVTFWGKRDLRFMLKMALEMLDAHYGDGNAK